MKTSLKCALTSCVVLGTEAAWWPFGQEKTLGDLKIEAYAALDRTYKARSLESLCRAIGSLYYFNTAAAEYNYREYKKIRSLFNNGRLVLTDYEIGTTVKLAPRFECDDFATTVFGWTDHKKEVERYAKALEQSEREVLDHYWNWITEASAVQEPDNADEVTVADAWWWPFGSHAEADVQAPGNGDAVAVDVVRPWALGTASVDGQIKDDAYRRIVENHKARYLYKLCGAVKSLYKGDGERARRTYMDLRKSDGSYFLNETEIGKTVEAAPTVVKCRDFVKSEFGWSVSQTEVKRYAQHLDVPIEQVYQQFNAELTLCVLEDLSTKEL